MTIIRLPDGQFDYDETQAIGQDWRLWTSFAGRWATDSDLAVKKLYFSTADAAHRELKIADELSGRVLTNIDSEEMLHLATISS